MGEHRVDPVGPSPGGVVFAVSLLIDGSCSLFYVVDESVPDYRVFLIFFVLGAVGHGTLQAEGELQDVLPRSRPRRQLLCNAHLLFTSYLTFSFLRSRVGTRPSCRAWVLS